MNSKKNFSFGDKILEILENSLDLEEDDFVAWKVARIKRDPFKILVAIILSQNTIEKNTLRAYVNLDRTIGVTPENIFNVDITRLKEAIRIAGLQDAKARTIKMLSTIIVKKLGGDSYKLEDMDIDKIQKILRNIPGIGRKTIDVFLANIGYPILPIDTHIKRVSYRIGLADYKSYEKMQMELHRVFRPKVRLKAHMYLIKLGRTYCKALRPKCDICPIREYCIKRV